MHADPSAFTVFNNPVASCQQKSFLVGLGHQRGFMLSELDRQFLTLLLPVKDAGVFSSGYLRNGNEIFSQQYVSAGFARKFGESICAFAGGWMYTVTQGEGYGSKTVPGASAGFSGKLGKSVTVSTLLELPAVKDEWLFPATVFQSGISIHCSEVCRLEASGDLQPDTPFELSLGIYYKPVEKVVFRTGIISAPFSFYGATELHLARFRLDISVVHQPQIGLTPRIGIAFETDKKDRN